MTVERRFEGKGAVVTGAGRGHRTSDGRGVRQGGRGRRPVRLARRRPRRGRGRDPRGGRQGRHARRRRVRAVGEPGCGPGLRRRLRASRLHGRQCRDRRFRVVPGRDGRVVGSADRDRPEGDSWPAVQERRPPDGQGGRWRRDSRRVLDERLPAGAGWRLLQHQQVGQVAVMHTAAMDLPSTESKSRDRPRHYQHTIVVAIKDPVEPRSFSTGPLGRFAEPIEIAHPILFMCSNDASFMSGALMVVDGLFGRPAGAGRARRTARSWRSSISRRETSRSMTTTPGPTRRSWRSSRRSSNR